MTGVRKFARVKVPPIAAAVHRAARRRALRAARRGDRGAHGPAVPRHGPAVPPLLPRDARRRRRGRRGRSRRPARRDRDRPATTATRRHADPTGDRRHDERRGARGPDARVGPGGIPGLRRRRTPRARRPLVLREPRSTRPEGRAVDAGHAARAPVAGGPAGRVRGGAARRHPGASPLRLLRILRRGVRGSGGAGPRRPRDQADPLSHLGRQPDHPLPGAGRRRRQAGGGPRRAEGAIRRGSQHLVRTNAGNGWGARGVRHGGPQDAREDLPGGAPGERRHPTVRAPGDRQLQLRRPRDCTKTSGC